MGNLCDSETKKEEQYSTRKTITDGVVNEQPTSSNEIKPSSDGIPLENFSHQETDKKSGKKNKGKNKDKKKKEQGKENKQTNDNGATKDKTFSNICGEDSQHQGTIASKDKDTRKPERNDKMNVNSKTAANQDEGHRNQDKKDNETNKQKQSTEQIKEQSSKISSNNDKGGSRGQGMHAVQGSVSGYERQSNSDKLRSPSQDSKVNQVNESGNSTTKTATKGGSQQSLTGQKSETSGNVTRISVNKSDSQHSLTSPKVETSRGKKIVSDREMQTDIKYFTESQYNEEQKERVEAQRLLKEKEEEISKLIAEREKALFKITREKDDLAKNKQMEIARIQSEKIKLEKEKDELLTRLSAMAGRKLTDNNPNIADLSDLNRPTKLAEKFSELYDNAWTDAFSVVQEQEGYKDNEEKAVKVLLDILTIAYKEASKAAEEELSSLKEIIERFQRSSDEKSVKDVMKQLKDSRKKKVQPSKDLKQVYHTAIEKMELDVSLNEKLKEYKDQCLDLCWLMVIQDPPVFLQCEACKEGDKFDKNTYREYTQGGEKVAFAVWPALFLEKGGALLSKGVVQCKKRPLSSSFSGKTGLDVKALLSNPKSQSLKMKGNKEEVLKAFQTEIRKPDAEKNGNMNSADERRNSSSQLQHF